MGNAADPLIWTDYVQAASWVGAVLTAGVGVYKIGQDNRKVREQREEEIAARQEANRVADRELNWRRAGAAQSSLEKMEEDKLAADAMLMLDWDGREYAVGEKTWRLTRAEVIAALRVSGEPFTDVEAFVRDAFDRLFWHLERVQHQVDIGLITLEHVRFPLAYLVGAIGKAPAPFVTFMRTYGYNGALKLLEEPALLAGPDARPRGDRPPLKSTTEPDRSTGNQVG